MPHNSKKLIKEVHVRTVSAEVWYVQEQQNESFWWYWNHFIEIPTLCEHKLVVNICHHCICLHNANIPADIKIIKIYSHCGSDAVMCTSPCSTSWASFNKTTHIRVSPKLIVWYTEELYLAMWRILWGCNDSHSSVVWCTLVCARKLLWIRFSDNRFFMEG